MSDEVLCWGVVMCGWWPIQETKEITNVCYCIESRGRNQSYEGGRSSGHER